MIATTEPGLPPKPGQPALRDSCDAIQSLARVAQRRAKVVLREAGVLHAAFD